MQLSVYIYYYYYYYYYYCCCYCYLPLVSRIPKDLEKNTRKWYEWPLLRLVVANEGVVEQHAIESLDYSLYQDGQTLK